MASKEPATTIISASSKRSEPEIGGALPSLHPSTVSAHTIFDSRVVSVLISKTPVNVSMVLVSSRPLTVALTLVGSLPNLEDGATLIDMPSEGRVQTSAPGVEFVAPTGCDEVDTVDCKPKWCFRVRLVEHAFITVHGTVALFYTPTCYERQDANEAIHLTFPIENVP